MSDDKDPASLRARIDRAKAAQDAKEAAKSPPPRTNAMSMGALALRYSMEFVVAVGVGGAIGYGIDHFAGTSPWGLLLFLCFGMAAGVLGMMRAYAELTAAATGETERPEYAPGPPDAEETNGKSD